MTALDCADTRTAMMPTDAGYTCWASRRTEVFDPEFLKTKNDPDKPYVRPRGWVEQEIQWMQAGMSATAAKVLGVILWKANEDLKHVVSISGTARDLRLSRGWTTEIKDLLCRIGLLQQTGNEPDRGLHFEFAKHDEMIRMIKENHHEWKRPKPVPSS